MYVKIDLKLFSFDKDILGKIFKIEPPFSLD